MQMMSLVYLGGQTETVSVFDIMGSDRVGHKPVCPHLHPNSDNYNLLKHKRKEGILCLFSPTGHYSDAPQTILVLTSY